MSRPKVGEPAPDFALSGHDGAVVRLSELRGRPVVLFFYPKDDTSVCTKEVCGFRDAYSELKAAGAEVFGVSGDSLESHQGFAGRHRLPYRLLADPDKSVHKLYGAEPRFGLLPRRVTFVIGKDGVVRAAHEALFSADDHVQAALAALR